MDLPISEELNALVAWFKEFYGPTWNEQLARDAGFPPHFIDNRVQGRATVSRRVVRKLEDLRATLVHNSCGPHVERPRPLNITARECQTCRRTLPIECYVLNRVKAGAFRNLHCNQCRSQRHGKLASTVRKHSLVQDALSKPCVDCGVERNPEANVLVHVRGSVSFVPAHAYRYVSEERLRLEIAKCDTLCACCARVRKAKKASVGKPVVPHVDLAFVPHSEPQTSAAQPHVEQ